MLSKDSSPDTSPEPHAGEVLNGKSGPSALTNIESRWDYSALGVRDVEADLAEVEQAVETLSKSNGRINEELSPEDFATLFHEYDRVQGLMTRIGLRVELPTDINTKDEAAQALKSQAQNKIAKLQEALLFVEHEFKDLSDDTAKSFISACPEHAYYLQRIRDYAPHTLSQESEALILSKNPNGIDSLIQLHNTITSNLVFKPTDKDLNESELRKLCHSTSRETRAQAYKSLYEVYGTRRQELALIYSARVNDWRSEMVERRKYKQPVSARNMENDLPDESIEALLLTCRANHDLFHRYFRFKGERLGLGTFSRHDLYAPVSTGDVNISYEHGAQLVQEAYDAFSPEFGSIVSGLRQRGHIDSQPRTGKVSGAYCAGAGITSDPYVFENYTGSISDVFTTAHEFGHAIHDVLAKVQTELTWHPPLPVAETASTFGELLLSQHMLSAHPELEETLLFREIDNFYAAVIRQATFAEFEVTAHDMIHDGASTSDLDAAYYSGLKDQFGPDVDLPDYFATEWLTVPHFVHYPFYVYAYSFGQLFSTALYQRYMDEGDEFVPQMRELLSLGGSMSPAELCQSAGFDINNTAHWQQGFEFLKSKIERLEEISAK